MAYATRVTSHVAVHPCSWRNNPPLCEAELSSRWVVNYQDLNSWMQGVSCVILIKESTSDLQLDVAVVQFREIIYCHTIFNSHRVLCLIAFGLLEF